MTEEYQEGFPTSGNDISSNSHYGAFSPIYSGITIHKQQYIVFKYRIIRIAVTDRKGHGLLVILA
ncbi:hypothetical protein AUJ95_07170 [Candidatus Desantisbacteria bacterium CG2_30_40_21]|uniref:Uncharacterized protein n=1 Tax=Candidatus Desantisbacteria bacterium CG2_30_40_21 TaxID=1817895 RepID=A0A1J5E465_9BACT|nr:MAG: hypothetical protein AUJ95_07170 [Candidatus Desantisbacteria bacterium CG2_30_40_21]